MEKDVIITECQLSSPLEITKCSELNEKGFMFTSTRMQTRTECDVITAWLRLLASRVLCLLGHLASW